MIHHASLKNKSHDLRDESGSESATLDTVTIGVSNHNTMNNDTIEETETNNQKKPQEKGQTRFLVGLDYADRAERRRVEYRLENWDGNVEQLPRMTRIIEGEDFFELYEDLQDTVESPENLSVYELNDLTPSAEEKTVRIDRVFDVELDRLEWATHSLLDKRSASQIDETTYEVRPDASNVGVTLEYHLMDVQQGSRLELSLTGPTPAPNAVKDAMLRDLGYLLPEPVEVFDS